MYQETGTALQIHMYQITTWYTVTVCGFYVLMYLIKKSEKEICILCIFKFCEIYAHTGYMLE
jgi:hypothetical protein